MPIWRYTVPRVRCCGLVEGMPCCQRFIAEGQPDHSPVILGIEEYEAVRLKDLEGLDQTECAEQMGLTRQTFQRVLQAARSKIAEALVHGRTIKIQGGNYVMKNREFECAKCGHRWEEAPCTEGGKHGYEIACPKCGSEAKFKITEGQKTACGGQRHQHGHGGCCGH